MLMNASRELTPADLRVLEPDLFGAVALVLHGREAVRSGGGRRTPPVSSAHERVPGGRDHGGRAGG